MTAGPCTSYLAGADLAGNSRVGAATAAELDPFCEEASQIMYVLLGRQFPGVCSATLRPIRRELESYMGRNWMATAYPFDSLSAPMAALLGVPTHSNGDPIPLPVTTRTLEAVMLDGAPFTDCALVGRNLYRTDGEPWPDTQKVWVADTEPGTFSVAITFGPDTPAGVVSATRELAIQLWLDSEASPDCLLPPGTTSVSRQGMSVSLDDRVEQARAAGPVIPVLSNALGTWNPSNQRQPPDYLSTADEWTLHVVPAAGS